MTENELRTRHNTRHTTVTTRTTHDTQVKVKGHAKTRRVGGTTKTKTQVQSQWEHVDCDFFR